MRNSWTILTNEKQLDYFNHRETTGFLLTKEKQLDYFNQQETAAVF